jgi:protein-tyrosine-phosphatase
MCRSPAAEKLLTLYGAKAGFMARSRGTAAQPYCRMPAQIEFFLKQAGVTDIAHKPALVTEEDIEWAELILVMEKGHSEILADKFPRSIGKTRLLAGGELRDPMGKSAAVYEAVMKQIEEAVKVLVAEKLKPPKGR